MIAVTKDTWQKEVVNKEYVLVDFWADWCVPCKMIAPYIQQLDDEKDWLTVVKLDVEANENLSSRFGIRSIPTMILFYHGKELGRSMGTSKDKLTALVNEELYG